MAADHRLKGAFVRKLLTVGCGRAYMVARQNGNNSEPRSRPVPRVRGGRAYWESPSGSLSWHRARACTCFLKIQRVGRTTQSSATSNLPVKPCFPLPQMDPPVAGACFFSRSFAMASRSAWMRAKSQARCSSVGVIALDTKAGSGYLQLCLLLSRFICEFGAPRVLSAWESFMRARDTTVQIIVPGSGCPKRLFVHNSRGHPQPGYNAHREEEPDEPDQ